MGEDAPAPAPAPPPPVSRAEAHKDFNRALKLYIRRLQEELPHVGEIGLLHAGYKMSKTLGKSLPRKLFMELLGGPYGDRIRAKDIEYFIAPSFDVPMFSGVVVAAQRECRAMTPRALERLVWEPVNKLMDLAARC